ncbi:MAG: M99 family carboxypeptidase catalytic domain-containing protein [Campylobacterota bacterium]|nr:M99 family carboxypeptidase catalytic domain-containing protein [Campylobacterota bacterium]
MRKTINKYTFLFTILLLFTACNEKNTPSSTIPVTKEQIKPIKSIETEKEEKELEPIKITKVEKKETIKTKKVKEKKIELVKQNLNTTKIKHPEAILIPKAVSYPEQKIKRQSSIATKKTIKNFDFDIIKKGFKDNNTLLIVGGIQGDEPGGFMAASLIATHYTITKGSVWIVPNLNFYSIIKRSRGPYGDMNRKFANLSKNDPEYESIQRIKGYIKDKSVKLIVNLHDGSGYYRPKYEDKLHSPYRWGQCSIIDQESIPTKKYSNLLNISNQVVKHVNKHLIKDEDIYHLHNTRTVEGDKEMEKTLTYYAINQGKAAFGNEASKNLPTHQRIYYHLVALEKYMDVMGIEYKRNFNLEDKVLKNIIDHDIAISLYDNKIKLPLSQIRNILKYFPVKKDGTIDFVPSNPLMSIVKKENVYTIYYGNRRLARLKADYVALDKDQKPIKLNIDSKDKNIEFGSLITVKNDFKVYNTKDYRVNVIGFTNKTKKETDILISHQKMKKRFSIDKKGSTYRIEFYKKEKFAGMILVKFAG